MFTKVRRPEFGIQRWQSGKQGYFPHLMSCCVCERGRGTCIKQQGQQPTNVCSVNAGDFVKTNLWSLVKASQDA